MKSRFAVGPTRRARLLAVALGLIGACGLPVCSAQAQQQADVAREVVNGVVRDIVQSVRDRVQSIVTMPPGRPLPFTAGQSNATAIYDDAFGALGYAGRPRGAPAFQPAIPATPSWLYGYNLTGTGNQNRSSSAGVTTTTNSFTLAGGGDITKIGIFTSSDALTVIATGSGTWAHATGIDSTTSGIAGTLVYINGGFSTDFTVGGLWTNASVSSLGVSTGSNTTSVSYAPNVQYKFELANKVWIEPTVGFTYSTSTSDLTGLGASIPVVPGLPNIPGIGAAGLSSVSGHAWEVHGGARIGTEVLWNNGVRVQPSLEGLAFSPFDSSPSSPLDNHVGGRGSAKVNFLWNSNFSSYIEGHIVGIENTSGYGGTLGLRVTW